VAAERRRGGGGDRDEPARRQPLLLLLLLRRIGRARARGPRAVREHSFKSCVRAQPLWSGGGASFRRARRKEEEDPSQQKMGPFLRLRCCSTLLFWMRAMAFEGGGASGRAVSRKKVGDVWGSVRRERALREREGALALALPFFSSLLPLLLHPHTLFLQSLNRESIESRQTTQRHCSPARTPSKTEQLRNMQPAAATRSPAARRRPAGATPTPTPRVIVAAPAAACALLVFAAPATRTASPRQPVVKRRARAEGGDEEKPTSAPPPPPSGRRDPTIAIAVGVAVLAYFGVAAIAWWQAYGPE
jgi:hypothetical protein